jgi:5'-phosphate synthase pdxT subunit
MSLLADGALLERLRTLARAGFPMFGTCAGMILLATEVGGQRSPYVGAIDIAVERNASGRQVDSFETTLVVDGIGDDVRAVFIRAPYIVRRGAGVTSMAHHEGVSVMAREANVLVCSFHPELTDDVRIHRYFVGMIEEANRAKEA